MEYAKLILPDIDIIRVEPSELAEVGFSLKTEIVGQSYRNGGLAIIMPDNDNLVTGQDYFVGQLLFNDKKIIPSISGRRHYFSLFASSEKKSDDMIKATFYRFRDNVPADLISIISKSGFNFGTCEIVGFYQKRKNPLIEEEKNKINMDNAEFGIIHGC